MGPQDAYDELLKRSNELAYLGSAVAVLDWDQRTQIPAKGHAHRVNQLAALARMRHKMITDPIIGECLATMEGSDLIRDSASMAAVNVREWRRSYNRAMKIPEELAVKLARSGAEGQAVWERARPRNDWALFKPYLERIVSLKRQEAEAVGYDQEPYDALLDVYEQGETARNLEPVFQRLTEALLPLIRRIESSPRRPNPEVLRGHFPMETQRSFAQAVARQLGYDLEAGRLDVSAHPFTTGIGPGDVRITTRYRVNDFSEAFFAVIHEAGHAIYHQGLPLEQWGSPICRPISLGINESQSRLWENMVARSEPFWQHFYPKARMIFPSLQEVSPEAFLHAINEVKPSLIRVEADEVTYNLHVLLRFELEVALIRGDLQVENLPEAWNRKMDRLLGLVPPDHAQGVMQDVHWSSGSIGYFPTYTLGNLYAAQFFQKARNDLGNLEESMAHGEFGDLLAWLRKNIHSRGSTYLPRDLLERVTGEALNPSYLIDYLETKYSALYEL